MKRLLRVSVRSLVEHSSRAGDLDLETFGFGSLLDSIRAHQKLQASRPEGYRSEVPVSGRFSRGDLELVVDGRMDGVLGTIVEEIKTTRDDPEKALSRERPTHWGQLKVYAFLHALEKELEVVGARLTYYQLDTGKTAAAERHFTQAELRVFVEDLVSRYLAWMSQILAWLERRNTSIASAGFPFPDYRPGQRGMAIAVYRAIRDGSQLLLQAPTGIGKTAAALFPALKALGEEKTNRVFYLTARTTGRALAESCLSDLRRSGVAVRSVTLTAKEKICFNPEKACNGEECEFARGFYDRLGNALAEVVNLQDFSRAEVESLARKHRVCPFELSLEIAPWCDVVIGDYNHVFDPRAYLRRFFDEGCDGTTLLVDEAHNLLDRAREMHSAQISRELFLELGRSLGGAAGRAARAVATELETSVLESVLEALADFLLEAESFLRAGADTDRLLRREVLERYFEAAWFTRVAEQLDDTYALCRESRDGDVRRKLFCRDPAKRLGERLSKVRSSVLFSATLAPLSYFRRTLGCAPSTPAFSIPPPFPGENLRVLVASGISTTYRRRSSTEAELTRLLGDFVASRKGNYLFYFPSYEYLAAIERRFAADFPHVEIAVQSPEMRESERADFLARFESTGRTLAGFAVMGGFFGEAIDLPGDKLEGAAIVGVGLPAPSLERDRIRDHFDREERAGFEYAYLYPGMNRVLQAAGRVIRSESDRGAVLLVDERFLEKRYQSLFPAEWRPRVVRNSHELKAELAEFWT